ncbi:MAG: metallophosphoesterase [Clostridia bacterium]|nr:metallophosphoesterase [Clostridia bacterium]
MYELNVIKTTVKIGLEKPVKFLHITDTHIALDDPERISGRAVGCFEGEYEGRTVEYFKLALDYAKSNKLPIVHTGDLIDFFSRASFNAVKELFTKDIDYIYAAGNHDFCHWVGEAKEDYEYKWENIKVIAPYIKSNLYFDSRVLGGVNFVTMDNSYYMISDGQIEMLKAEAAKGYPILLCMHIPFYGPYCKEQIEKGIAELQVDIPEKYIANYPPERQHQVRPDAATLRAVEYIKNEPMIKAIIAGHNHCNVEETLDSGLLQIATAGTFDGFVREITLI